MNRNISGHDKRDRLTEYCLDYDARFACNGGCPKDRFATSAYCRSEAQSG
jgi:radical SAM protein with 4Fe4S-binding SPASM domain